MSKDKPAVPRHVAIIMDGNGRWAKVRHQPRLFGHRAGAESLRIILKACRKFGVEILTVYAFSTENWSRPRDEVGGLMTLLKQFLRKDEKELLRLMSEESVELTDEQMEAISGGGPLGDWVESLPDDGKEPS